ncbi:hypothetical protein GCM10011408_22740 [Dyella caseinilytica]|nr:hypothetical protein GCM10011408_22740 [Dyella caseinilytica]
MIGLVTGCATKGVPASSTDPAASSTTVTCTINAPSAMPCADQARQACSSDVRLQTIRSRNEIPVTEGAPQYSAPLYQYTATYACHR